MRIHEDLREQLDGKAEAVYYIRKRMFFSLTDGEMKTPLPRWISLQWQMDKLYPMRRQRRMKLLLITLTRSVWLTRLLVGTEIPKS